MIMAKKIILSFLCFVFLLFAFFQWNDPDGLKWIVYYLIVAALCFLSLINKNRMTYIYLMLGLTVLWMILLMPSAINWINDGMPSIVDSMQASSPYIELVREFLGLFITLLVLILLLLMERKSTF